jgi:hypothetical protein
MNELVSLSETAAKVSNELSLIAFIAAALIWVVWFVSRKRSLSRSATNILMSIVVALVALASLPFAARAYLVNRGVFRLRVTVEDLHGMPMNEAKVTCSIGGEPKRVDGGWEFDIPQGSRPTDGKLTIYAEVKSAFLAGKSDVVLGDDYNLVAKVRLDHDRNAHVRGRVVDRKQIPIVGALVSVVGYESEAQNTGALGQFDLPSHASDGQSIQVSAFKKGFGSVAEWKQAGDQPATIVLPQ